eukprot:c14998_g1_i1 orf=284-691(-)
MLPNFGLRGSKSRDEALARVNQDKTFSRIQAWEETEKSKVLNKYAKAVVKITAWENTRNATAETVLKKDEEKLERRRAVYLEKMKNMIAEVHRQAEEMRAAAKAMKAQELLRIEDVAAKFRSEGYMPNRCLCFGA